VSNIFADGGVAVLDLLKTQGLPAINTQLQSLADSATEGWQKSLLKLGVAFVADHGADGLDLLEGAVQNMQSGHPVDLSKLTMEEASDLLAAMQRKEADTENRIALYTQVLIDTIGKVLSTLASTIFAGIKL
jgi:hypothetical protein